MSEANHLRDLEEKHNETIQNIQNLQELEKYMFQNLQKMTPGGSQSALEQEAIVNKINELKTMRTGLLQQLSSLYQEKQSELNSERGDLSDKIAQVGMVESELDKARKNVGMLQNDHNNKLRMAQIYENQRKRYGAYTDVMKLVVYVCLVILALTLLLKYKPIPMVPPHVYTMLITLSVVVGVILVIRKVMDINSRSSFDFDQYNFYFDPASVQPGYQSVYQHDVGFFQKLGQESGFDKYAGEASAEMQKANAELSKMSQSLANGTAAGAGTSNGVSNDPTSVAKIPNSTSVVMPSESSKETFASIN